MRGSARPGKPFLYAPAMAVRTAVQHRGLSAGCMQMYDEDIEMLAANGYIEFLDGKAYFILGPNGSEE